MDIQDVTNIVVGLTQVVTLLILVAIMIKLRRIECKCRCNCPPVPPVQDEAVRIDLELDDIKTIEKLH